MLNPLNFQANSLEENEEESSTYLSIGDLMSGLLMFFALLFITALIQLTYAQKGTTKALVEELEKKLKINNIDATVDQKTGDLSLKDSILFDRNSSKLNPKGQKLLQKLMPIYSQIIFGTPKIKDNVQRVIIEGHTSADGSPDFNMELSLMRAWEVTNYTLYKMPFPNDAFKPQLEKAMMVVGRGRNDATQGDIPSERKVVFRIQFKGQDLENINLNPKK